VHVGAGGQVPAGGAPGIDLLVENSIVAPLVRVDRVSPRSCAATADINANMTTMQLTDIHGYLMTVPPSHCYVALNYTVQSA